MFDLRRADSMAVITFHESLQAAYNADKAFQAAVRRGHGETAYVKTVITDENGVVERADARWNRVEL